MFFDLKAVQNGAWAQPAPENDNAAALLIMPTLPESRFFNVRLPAPSSLMRDVEIQPRRPAEKPEPVVFSGKLPAPDSLMRDVRIVPRAPIAAVVEAVAEVQETTVAAIAPVLPDIKKDIAAAMRAPVAKQEAPLAEKPRGTLKLGMTAAARKPETEENTAKKETLSLGRKISLPGSKKAVLSRTFSAEDRAAARGPKKPRTGATSFNAMGLGIPAAEKISRNTPDDAIIAAIKAGVRQAEELVQEKGSLEAILTPPTRVFNESLADMRARMEQQAQAETTKNYDHIREAFKREMQAVTGGQAAEKTGLSEKTGTVFSKPQAQQAQAAPQPRKEALPTRAAA